jgi:hypothetical protein
MRSEWRSDSRRGRKPARRDGMLSRGILRELSTSEARDESSPVAADSLDHGVRGLVDDLKIAIPSVPAS